MVLAKALVKMIFPQFSSVSFALFWAGEHLEQGLLDPSPWTLFSLSSRGIPMPAERHNISKA